MCNRSGEKGWHAREVQSRYGIMQFNINHIFLTILWLDIKPPPQRLTLSIQESCSFQDYLNIFVTYHILHNIIIWQTSAFSIGILVIVIYTLEEFSTHILFQELLQKADLGSNLQKM